MSNRDDDTESQEETKIVTQREGDGNETETKDRHKVRRDEVQRDEKKGKRETEVERNRKIRRGSPPLVHDVFGTHI